MFKDKRLLMNNLFPSSERRKIHHLFALMLLAGMLEVVGLVSIAPFLAIVTDPEMIFKHSYIHYVYSKLQFSRITYFIAFLGFSFLIIMILTSNLNVFLHWKINKFIQYSTARIAQDLFRKYLFMPYTFYLDIHSSEISKNILNEVARAIELVVYPFLIALTKFSVSVLIVIILFLVDPFVALTTFSIFSMYYLLAFKYLKKKIGIMGEATTTAISARYKVISESISGIKEIKLKRKEEECCTLFRAPSEDFAEYLVTRQLFAAVPKVLVEIVTYSLVTFIIVYLTLTEPNAGKRISIIALYGFAAYRLIPSLHAAYDCVTQIKFNFSSLESLSYRLSAMSKSVNVESCGEHMDFSKKVQLNNVSYCYANSKENAVENISFEFAPGSRIGLVGESGSGKSTLVDIILGLLEVQSGEINLGTVCLKPHNIDSWQERLSYVPQDIFLFDGTIEENIAFNLAAKSIDSERIEKVIQQSMLTEFINSLSEGKKTLVGERGVRISGGQKQRIGIARALYKNADLLILDEATSAIDSITERKVMHSLATLKNKPAIIMIAHRVSTVINCDLIYVLKKGRIISSGSFGYLSENCEYFRNLSK